MVFIKIKNFSSSKSKLHIGRKYLQYTYATKVCIQHVPWSPKNKYPRDQKWVEFKLQRTLWRQHCCMEMLNNSPSLHIMRKRDSIWILAFLAPKPILPATHTLNWDSRDLGFPWPPVSLQASLYLSQLQPSCPSLEWSPALLTSWGKRESD